MSGIPARIDHTLLKPEATRADVERLAEEAAAHVMAAAVVLPYWVPLVQRLLSSSPVAVCSVVGFPLAHESPPILERAARALTSAGADEIDMVISTGLLLSGDEAEVSEQIRSVVRGVMAENRAGLVKVIMETHLLDDEHLTRGCRIAEEEGAAFVKTTTGFTGGGATPREVHRLKARVGDRLLVKASAGIRTLEQAEELVAAGADRLGTSAGRLIAEQWEQREDHVGAA